MNDWSDRIFKCDQEIRKTYESIAGKIKTIEDSKKSILKEAKASLLAMWRQYLPFTRPQMSFQERIASTPVTYTIYSDRDEHLKVLLRMSPVDRSKIIGQLGYSVDSISLPDGCVVKQKDGKWFLIEEWCLSEDYEDTESIPLINSISVDELLKIHFIVDKLGLYDPILDEINKNIMYFN